MVENLGRGLTLIKKLFNEFNLKSPEWTFQSGYTKLTLFGIPEPITVYERMLDFINQTEPNRAYNGEDYMAFFQMMTKKELPEWNFKS